MGQIKFDLIGPGVERLRRVSRKYPNLRRRLKEAIDAGERASQIIFEHNHMTDVPVIRNFSEWVGFLAAEVGILLDGTYTPREIDLVCNKIADGLEDKFAQTITLKEVTPNDSQSGQKLLEAGDTVSAVAASTSSDHP